MEPYAMIQVSVLLSVKNSWVEMSHHCFISIFWRNPWQPLAEPWLENTTITITPVQGRSQDFSKGGAEVMEAKAL